MQKSIIKRRKGEKIERKNLEKKVIKRGNEECEVKKIWWKGKEEEKSKERERMEKNGRIKKKENK